MKASARIRTLEAIGRCVPLVLAAACGDEGGEPPAASQPVELEPVRAARDSAPARLANGDALPSVAERSSAHRTSDEPSAAQGAFECEDTCSSKRAECGLVCEESCGECASDERCEDNRCVCQSGCDGSRCIDDCGRPCGCPAGSACNAGGFCVALDACGDGSCPPQLNPPSAPSPLPVPPIPEGPGFR